jgi:uncharacterized protein
VPGLFNVLTTGAGLLSLLWVDIPPVQTFGLSGAIGTLMVFLVVFILVPPILLKWDTPRWPRRRSGLAHARHIAAAIAVFSLRNSRAVLIGTLLLVLAAIPLAMQVKVESNLIEFLRRTTASAAAPTASRRSCPASPRWRSCSPAAGRDSLKNPATLAQIKALQTWLEQQPEIDRSFSLVEVIEEMNRAFSGEDPGADALPTNRRLVEQLLLIYDGEDCTNWSTANSSAAASRSISMSTAPMKSAR